MEAVSRSTALALTHDVHVELQLTEEDFEFFDAPTWGDPELVSSAVENLIRNAIRFSTRGGLIQVSVTGVPAVDGEEGLEGRPRAVIRVKDQGPGMPADILETVFQPFKQGEGERSRGTGLGLAIAHKVTELHQGRIRAHNRDDGETGCVVEITLPFLAEGDWGGDRAVTADHSHGERDQELPAERPRPFGRGPGSERGGAGAPTRRRAGESRKAPRCGGGRASGAARPRATAPEGLPAGPVAHEISRRRPCRTPSGSLRDASATPPAPRVAGGREARDARSRPAPRAMIFARESAPPTDPTPSRETPRPLPRRMPR